LLRQRSPHHQCEQCERHEDHLTESRDGIRTAVPRQSTIEKHYDALPCSELPEWIAKLRTTNAALSVKLAFEFLIPTAIQAY
jgi:hypothetical protein